MEEDKSKRNKRNKKKKNKQSTKTTESVSLDASDSTSNSQNHTLERVEYNNDQVSGTTEKQRDVGAHTNTVNDGDLANCTDGAEFLEKDKEQQAEKDAQIQTQVFLKEKTKQLLRENEKDSQKEASQKHKIEQLQHEKKAYLQNEAFLNEKLLQLRKEKDAFIQKEGNLERKIQQLRHEVDSHSHKEASLASKVLIMEAEKESWLKKEAVYEKKINQLAEEAEVLNSEVNSAKESIAILNNNNIQLQAQVIKLEHARDTLLEEREQLEELNSSPKLLTKNLGGTDGLSHSPMDTKAPSEEDMNFQQITSARAIPDKLITENSELIEKMNELYGELDQRDQSGIEDVSSAHYVHGAPCAPSGDESALMAVRTAQVTDSVSEISQESSMLEGSQLLEDMIMEDRRNGMGVNVNNDGYRIGSISEIIEADDEIVQIPLDEQEVRESNSIRAQNEEKTDVPLTDAPLIGAPFRFISFVSRYVSGADLVK